MTTTLTNSQLLDMFNTTAELEADAMELVIDFTGHALQRQGDVLVHRNTSLTAATTPVPADGIAVVAAEARQGNTHMLHAYEGDVCFDVNASVFDGQRVVYGTLTIGDGAKAVLIHTGEHPALGLTEGTYLICGQVEGAQELRRVMD